ncbi:MAG: UDP-N-acetylmuramoyl-L-alanyl-D-glutamate-2, 6-diaminopimelate ligase MurE [Thermoanaerobacterales bacterium 50_218]|nr:MAG: UDP-N-acetylmuramoyl-L-alanyl-D-glutamate-2, 6-diaminopimelate ligase MurE [Thermoanaerobacterales bacterium 50_218]HAA89159.1 DUF1727 domain-containing protein [Peptococcaceae bacterium]
MNAVDSGSVRKKGVRNQVKPGAVLRLLLAVLLGKLVAFCCRLFRYPGTSLPGHTALKVFPRLVEHLAGGYQKVIAVTGTNGKTTTANLIAHVLREAGFRVAHNSEGANMLPGVAAALLRDCDLLGRISSQVAVLEVDEGSVGKVFAAARPDLVVVTNYFRDQLDRYWELERTTGLLREAVSKLPGVTLVLNADDPLVAAVGRGQEQVLYYGVEEQSCTGSLFTEEPVPANSGKGHDWSALCEVVSGDRLISGGGIAEIFGETREGRFCSFCGSPLTYRCYHYGQLGDYSCPECGYRRPRPDFAASGVKCGEGRLSFTLSVFRSEDSFISLLGKIDTFSNRGGYGRERHQVEAPLRGFYNTYNLLAAAAAVLTLGVSPATLQKAVSTYTPATGRMEEFFLAGRRCTLALVKNPVGANQVLRTVKESRASKALVIAINDLAADGRDVSWLWDADFALLADPSVVRIICSGRRAADLAVCLKYSGVDTGKIAVVPEQEESLKLLSQEEAGEFYVLATYTNLFTYARLLRLGKVVADSEAQGLPSLS